jgi:opacity protein-like surface antigen
MKKIILTIAAVFAFGAANAQDMKFGVRGGLDLVSVKTASVTFDGETYGGSSESLTGFFAGGFVEFGLADKFVLQPGISYHMASKGSGEAKIKADFLSIPVIVKYAVAEKINILAGPALYYSMDSKDSDKTRFNLELGASYDITENFFVDPRYSIGLTGDAKVSHFLIGVGYKF